MPWRETSDPYHIWVSEVMLQQTQVSTVTPYYQRFIKAFPTVEVLAHVPLERVLKLWEGLGYYSRARNLHKTAKILLSEYNGALPSTVEELTALPGIGRSTAGAIASIAFRKDEPILDGNVKRVISRLMALQDDLKKPETERKLWKASRQLILKGKGRETALALMDLGATLCVPKNPRCSFCPLTSFCKAYQSDLQEFIPLKARKKPIPHYDVVVAVISGPRGVFIQQRPPEGLLGGLWEFPGGKREQAETLEAALEREIREELGVRVRILEKIDTIPHGYTHFRITLHGYLCEKVEGRIKTRLNHAWVAKERLSSYPFPRANQKLLEKIVSS